LRDNAGEILVQFTSRCGRRNIAYDNLCLLTVSLWYISIAITEEGMKIVYWILAGLPLLVVSACAPMDEQTAGQRGDPARVCLNDHEITSFNPIDDDHLYIEGIGNKHYLFTMQKGCIGLRSANTIGIPDRVGRICSNSSDRVIYRDMVRGAEYCRILDIEIVQDREEARALAEARKKSRRN
jgi:hypothetical protein